MDLSVKRPVYEESDKYLVIKNNIVDIVDSIKFKGKRIDTNKWVYGHFYIYEGYEPRIYCYGNDVKDMTGIFKNSLNRGCGYHHVYTSSISRYTGEIDSKCNDIYSGDILKILTHSGITIYTSVCFSNGCWKLKNDKKIFKTILSDMLYKYHCEIVGNIHDNDFSAYISESFNFIKYMKYIKYIFFKKLKKYRLYIVTQNYTDDNGVTKSKMYNIYELLSFTNNAGIKRVQKIIKKNDPDIDITTLSIVNDMLEVKNE